jgi:hypothetical protein
MSHKDIYKAGRPVYIVDGIRTPFLKARGRPGPFTASDLAVAAGKALLLRQPFPAEEHRPGRGAPPRLRQGCSGLDSSA